MVVGMVGYGTSELTLYKTKKKKNYKYLNNIFS